MDVEIFQYISKRFLLAKTLKSGTSYFKHVYNILINRHLTSSICHHLTCCLFLPQCTSKEGGSETMDLINCRIKIWWPMDKKWVSFHLENKYICSTGKKDQEKKEKLEHEICYLCLRNQKSIYLNYWFISHPFPVKN